MNLIGVSSNPDAIYLLEQFSDKIDWTALFVNPSIFINAE